MARPKGSKNKRTVFLNQLLDEKNCDWRTRLVRTLKRMDERMFYQELKFWAPYLLSKIEPKEWKPTTPQESLQNAISTQKLLEDLENDATTNTAGDTGKKARIVEKGSDGKTR